MFFLYDLQTRTTKQQLNTTSFERIQRIRMLQTTKELLVFGEKHAI